MPPGKSRLVEPRANLEPDAAVVEAEDSWLRRFRYAPRPVKLTAVQWLIAQLVACGLADKEIAHLLEISAATVKAHHSNTMHALDFVRRAQLVRYIFETGQFDPVEAERMIAERKLRRSRPPRPRFSSAKDRLVGSEVF